MNTDISAQSLRQLKEKLDSSDIKYTRIARDLNVSRSWLSQVLNGKKKPSYEIYLKITKYTQDLVDRGFAA